jgi:hypothetical protein
VIGREPGGREILAAKPKPAAAVKSPERGVCALGMMDFHHRANHLAIIEKELLNRIR